MLVPIVGLYFAIPGPSLNLPHRFVYMLWFHLLLLFFPPIQAFLTQLVCHLLDEGNSCYRDGDWQQATQQYSEGISVARYAQAEALVIPHELLECLYVNRAAAFFQAVSHSAMRGGNVIFIAI